MIQRSTSSVTSNQPAVVLLGLGRWGSNHLRLLRSLPVELYCVDTDTARLDRLVKDGVPEGRLSTDPYAFIDKVEGAVVVTPAPSHYMICRRYLEAGRDVFVEKPLALISREARELAELADARGRLLQVGHIFRFDPASRWLRAAVAAGKFGRLKIMRGNFSGFKRPRSDSGVTFADAIHFVDLFNYFIGRPPLAVTAIVRDFIGRGMDDESWISLDYPMPDGGDGQVWATVGAGYHTPGKYRQVEVLGDQLSALCDFNVAQYKVQTHEARHEVGRDGIVAIEKTSRQLEFAPEEPLLAELRAFLQAIEARTPVQAQADGWSGYWSVRVIERALESAQLGRTLPLDG